MKNSVQGARRRALGLAAGTAAGVLLAVTGLALLTDRPGLRAEYFALGPAWQGPPIEITVAPPTLAVGSEAQRVLLTKVLFSVRWTGFWEVREAGRHLFAIAADDGAYLRIDDELVVDTAGVFGDKLRRGRVELEPGLHPIEIGFYQTVGDAELEVVWAGPGASRDEMTALPTGELYASSPARPRRWMRRVLADWLRPFRQLLGAALLLAVGLALGRHAARHGAAPERFSARLANAAQRTSVRLALLAGLFATTFLGLLPFTGSITGGDDTAYLGAAFFGQKSWFFGRYIHVYLVKLFVTLCGGDPFLGSRLWWSFVFAVTVAALAVAVASIGSRLQLRTLAVTLFVLFAQTSLFGLIGAAFADHTAMMFVTLGVAVYLHGPARARAQPRPRHEWHALVLGAVTVGAFRSKEVGAVLLLLLVLLALVEGRVDLRRFARRLPYWAAGAIGVHLVLGLLDAWILGDFFFAFDADRLARARQMNFPAGLVRASTDGWLGVVWRPEGHPASLSLRNLWIGAAAAAVAAGFTRQRLEIRLLHCLPLAYLAALVVLYIWMPHPFSIRMLIPILPVACLMTGLLAHHLKIEELSVASLGSPAVAIPAGLGAAIFALIVIPYRMQTLDAADFLPAQAVRRFGWEPDAFVWSVLLPIAVLATAGALAFVAAHRRGALAGLLLAYLAAFGVGFSYNRMSLDRGWAAQSSALLRYPWRTFHQPLAESGAPTVALSPDLKWAYRMTAATRSTLAQLEQRRPDIWVTLARDGAPRTSQLAIASLPAYQIWRRELPALETTAVYDPNGFLVLVRPKEAVRAAAAGDASGEQDPRGSASE